jgi:syntaxin-binding protein 1
LLDDDSTGPRDRLRLLALYTLYKDGLFPGDRSKLIAHAQLPSHDAETIENIDLLGATANRAFKDHKPGPPPLFPRSDPTAGEEQSPLSRFEPGVKMLLSDICKNTLDATMFPFLKPQEQGDAAEIQSQASLRRAQPNWARRGGASNEPRQRIIVFVAGGATYSEARSCYEVSQANGKDVFLISTHMQNPSLFVRQLADLSVERRRLDLPADRPPQKAPAHLFEPDPKPASAPPSSQPYAPPTAAMSNLSVSKSNGRDPARGTSPMPQSRQESAPRPEKREKEEKKKKHFFSSKK